MVKVLIWRWPVGYDDKKDSDRGVSQNSIVNYALGEGLACLKGFRRSEKEIDYKKGLEMHCITITIYKGMRD